jgi:ComF family protein
MSSGEPFCEACIAKLTTPDGMYCKRCGGKHKRHHRKTFGCSRCRTLTFRFRRVIALGEYEAELRELILRMKTDRSGFLARTVTQLLVRKRRQEFHETNTDLIIPVPMYWLRRWMRGVNSPDILAEELGRILKIPVASKLVQRIRPTEVQYLLSAHNRAANVANAFALKQQNNWWNNLLNKSNRLSQSNRLSKGNRLKNVWNNLLSYWFGIGANTRAERFSSDLSGKNVLLVDDIFTTGSTCNEVAKVLRQAGVRSITVCVFARAVGYYAQRRTNLLENIAKKPRF